MISYEMNHSIQLRISVIEKKLENDSAVCRVGLENKTPVPSAEWCLEQRVKEHFVLAVIVIEVNFSLMVFHFISSCTYCLL